MNFLKRIRHTLEMIKFSHSVFALPFALASMLVAADGWPENRTLLLIVLAMVTARNAAMAYNRYADAEIDAKNPRTRNRHIPQGILSKKFVLGFALLNGALFIAIASFFNTLTFILSPIVLALLILYSYTKRVTDWSHLVLGFILGLAPIGAWIAIREEIAWPPVLLSLAVLFWVSGFDIIYASQDAEFDRREGLHSLIVRWGINKALWFSRLCHLIAIGLLFAFGQRLHLGPIYLGFVAVIAVFLLIEQLMVSPKNLSRVNAAFFTANGAVSILYLVGICVSQQYFF